MSVKVADVDENGLIDLVVINAGTGDVGILLGNGDGTFQAQVTVPTVSGSYPPDVAVGYINHDDHLDLAVANMMANTVCVLFGNGNGTFTEKVTLSTGSDSNPAAIVLNDFNRDDHMDLAVIHQNTNNIGVLLGNGYGTFSEQLISSIKSGCSPSSVVGGDFNRDNQSDLAVTCFATDSTHVFLGTGNGTFNLHTVLLSQARSNPTSIAVGDVNCDKRLDVAVANGWQFNVGVSLGVGNGSFASTTTYPTGVYSRPYSMVFDDFNNDDQLDIAVTNLLGQNVGILLGIGNGTFLEQMTFPIKAETPHLSIAAGDFNHDRKMDLVIVDFSNSYAHVLLNTCDCCVPRGVNKCVHKHS